MYDQVQVFILNDPVQQVSLCSLSEDAKCVASLLTKLLSHNFCLRKCSLREIRKEKLPSGSFYLIFFFFGGTTWLEGS